MAPWTISKVAKRLDNSTSYAAYAIPSFFCFVAFIVFHIGEIGCDGLWSIAWTFYLGFATIMTGVRIQCREKLDINGNAYEDFFASLFFYPNVALQLDLTTQNLGVQEEAAKPNEIKLEEAENGKVNNAFEN